MLRHLKLLHHMDGEPVTCRREHDWQGRAQYFPDWASISTRTPSGLSVSCKAMRVADVVDADIEPQPHACPI